MTTDPFPIRLHIRSFGEVEPRVWDQLQRCATPDTGAIERGEISMCRGFRKHERGLSEIGAIIIVVAVIIASVFAYYAVLPWFYGQQYAAERRSQPYVQTQQAGLVELLAKYHGTQDPDEQAAILLQMQQLATTIAPNQIPPAVAQFLAAHPQ